MSNRLTVLPAVMRMKALSRASVRKFVAERALIADDLLTMTYQDLLLYFDLVKGDDEAGSAAFAMEFEVTVQLEIHDSIR